MKLTISQETISFFVKNIRVKIIEITKTIKNINIRRIKINTKRLKRNIDIIKIIIKENIRQEITKILHNIGMREELTGYNCFLEGIYYALLIDTQRSNRYMYYLYEEINSKQNKNIYAIERDMRYAKEATWRYSSLLYIEKILGYQFNYKHSSPTNTELILILTECLRITIGY